MDKTLEDLTIRHVLGELTEAESATLHKAGFQDPELRRLVSGIREAIALLGLEAPTHAPPRHAARRALAQIRSKTSSVRWVN